MNSDFRDLLRLCAEHEVRFLIVGGYAAIHYSQPRLTKDMDLWLEPSKENASRLMRVFHAFGIPLITAFHTFRSGVRAGPRRRFGKGHPTLRLSGFC